MNALSDERTVMSDGTGHIAAIPGMSWAADPWAIIARPFAWDDVKVREGRGKKLFVYIQAPAVRARLNEAFGHGNWSSTVRFEKMETLSTVEIGPEDARPEDKTVRIFQEQWMACTTRIEVVEPLTGRVIVREESTDLSDISPTEGGVSNSLKRAFCALGNDTLKGLEFTGLKVNQTTQLRAAYEKAVGLDSTPSNVVFVSFLDFMRSIGADESAINGVSLLCEAHGGELDKFAQACQKKGVENLLKVIQGALKIWPYQGKVDVDKLDTRFTSTLRPARSASDAKQGVS